MASERASWVLKKTIDKLSSLLSSAPFASASTSSTGPSSDGSSQEVLRSLHRTMEEIHAISTNFSKDSHKKELLLRELIEVAYEAEHAIDEYQYEVVLSRLQSPVFSLKEGNQMSDLVPVQQPNELCISHSVKRTLASGKEASELCPSSITVPLPDVLTVRVRRISKKFEKIAKEWPDLNLMKSDGFSIHGRGNEKILPALKLSYDHMRSQQKKCFLVFSLFPKDFVFVREDIAKLWLALDLVEPSYNQRLEEIANNYFADFVQRSFIVPNSYNTREKGFLMHDLVHDLAQFLAGEESTRAVARKLNTTLPSNSGTHSRYVSVIVNKLPQAVNLRPLQEYHQLRSLQIINKANKWNNCINIDLSDEQFQFLRHLRVLDLRYTGIETLPNSIGNLEQLRYLNLTRTNVSKLPESISHLFNLETLELRDCSFQELPQGITNLVNLRHLNFFDKNTCMPRGIGWLINLQTLPVLNIKKGSWHCEISELKGLINLRGELIITGLRNVSCAKGAYEANLQSKENLQALTLDWSKGAQMKCNHYDRPSFEGTNSELEQVVDLATGKIDAVLENLQPNIRLKELSIVNYFGHRFPKWFGDTSFSQLVRITLNGCGENCKVLPTLGLLPSLKSLYVLWMHNVQFIGREFCSHNVETKGFRSLETLEFKYMPNWVRWFGVEDGEFCRLHALRIVCCNQLQSLPQIQLSSITKLMILNCRELGLLPFLPSLARLTLLGELSESLLYNLTLPSLKFLKIACSQNIKSLSLNGHKFPSIEVLVIKGCKYLESIVGISSMTSLKRLEIFRCRFVQIYSNEDIPPSLQHLTIVRCHWLREWHERITIKYRNQLNRDNAANSSLKELGMREEDIDYQMVFEETEGHYDFVSTNDIKIEKRPRVIEEGQVWLEAKRKKNTLELGDSSVRNLVPMGDDQDIILLHGDQLTRGSVANNSLEALDEMSEMQEMWEAQPIWKILVMQVPREMEKLLEEDNDGWMLDMGEMWEPLEEDSDDWGLNMAEMWEEDSYDWDMVEMWGMQEEDSDDWGLNMAEMWEEDSYDWDMAEMWGMQEEDSDDGGLAEMWEEDSYDWDMAEMWGMQEEDSDDGGLAEMWEEDRDDWGSCMAEIWGLQEDDSDDEC